MPDPSHEYDLLALQQEGKDSLARLMLALYRTFNALAQEKYASHGHAGLTTAHTLLFANLDADGTRIVTLAERMGTTKQFTGRLVHQLAERGYISIEPDPADRRATLVRTTPVGLQFFADACAVKLEIEEKFKSVIGEEAFAALMTSLGKLAGTFAAYAKQGSIQVDSDADSDE